MNRKYCLMVSIVMAVCLTGCRPKATVPQHEAELAIQLGKQDSTGATGVIFARDLGFDKKQNKVTFEAGRDKATSQTQPRDEVKWEFQGISGGADQYKLRRKETVKKKQVGETQKVTVEFNGKDPVVAWDDTRFIVIRPLSAKTKEDAVQKKSERESKKQDLSSTMKK